MSHVTRVPVFYLTHPRLLLLSAFRWLEKRGGGTSRLGNKRYKKRWFELVRTTTGVFLTYQCEPGDGVLKGAIEMHSVWLQNVRAPNAQCTHLFQSL